MEITKRRPSLAVAIPCKPIPFNAMTLKAVRETRMVQFDEIFLPYMMNRNGLTYFEAHQKNLLLVGE